MRKTKLSLCILLGTLIFFSCTKQQKVSWISTTDESRWQQHPEILLTTGENKSSYIEILPENPRQTIDGFGACFNELSWDALQLVDEATRNQILKDLFDPNEGLKFSFCRTSMGANDYAREWYSYDETDNDFELKNFSIERDKEAVIPFIKSALKLNPHIKLWASPWSAPTWMKTNHHYANMSGSCNDLAKEKEVPLYTDQVIQQPEYLQAFALYFSKYLDAYKKERIDISMVVYQNEAFTFSQWPNGSWKPQSIANFYGKYLGPQLAKTHPEVELYAGTFNTSDSVVFNMVMNDPEAKKYIKGIAVQWEGRDIFPELHKKFPDVKLMQSESECGWGKFGWSDAEHTFNLMKKYFNGGANSYIGWNMILKDDGSSSWCWKQNALIRIMSDTKEVIYTPEYYVYKHISSFVPAGSVMLSIEKNNKTDNSPDNNTLAFKTPDNRIIIISANYNEENEEKNFKIGNKYFTVSMAPKSFNSFEIIPS